MSFVTAAGSGQHSRWEPRRQPVAGRPHPGQLRHLLLDQERSGQSLVCGPPEAHPGLEPDSYQAAYSEDKGGDQRGSDGSIATTLCLWWSRRSTTPKSRRAQVTNLGTEPRGSRGHPDGTGLGLLARLKHPDRLLQSVRANRVGALAVMPCSATRRPRSVEEGPAACSPDAVGGDRRGVGGVQFETDRARFLGRGNQIHRGWGGPSPSSSTPLCWVLDPVFSLRRKMRIEAGATVHLVFTTVVANTRADALNLIDKFSDPVLPSNAARPSAWTQAQVLGSIISGIHPEQAHAFQQLGGQARSGSRPGPEYGSSISNDAGDCQPGGAVEVRHLGRPSDGGGSNRPARGARPHPRSFARSGVLRMKGLPRRPRHHQREARFLCGGSPGCDRRVYQEAGHGAAQARLAGSLRPQRSHVMASVIARVCNPPAWCGRRRSATTGPSPTSWPAVRRTLPASSDLCHPSAPEPPDVPGPETRNWNIATASGGFALDGREYVVILGEGQSSSLLPWINVARQRAIALSRV